MANYNVKPLRLTVRSSPRLACVFIAAGVVAGLCVLLAPLPWWVKAPVLIVVTLATWHALALHAWQRLPAACCGIEIDGKGRLVLQRRDGSTAEAVVERDSIVTVPLTILNLRLAQGRKRVSVLLTPDRVEAETYRRLRVWLRWADGHKAGDQGRRLDVR